MIQWTKLPFFFAPELLRADIAAIPDEAWIPHFNANDYEGRWSSLSLRSRTGSVEDCVAHGEVAEFHDTPLMQQCPHLRAAVEAFGFSKKAVRLLRLQAGSRVREHKDRDLGLDVGEIRLHIPVATNEKLEFVVANRRLILREGEAWYIDFSQPHRIYNGGDTDRIHLIIDGRVNDWVLAMLDRATKEIVTETFDPPGVVDFEAFRNLVYDDPELRAKLMPINTREELFAAVVEAGVQHGFSFERDVVESIFKREHQQWMLRSATI